MITLSVLYPKTSESTFDLDYYLTKHIPMVLDRLQSMGLVGGVVEEGMGGGAPGEPPPFAVMGRLSFDTMDNLQRSLAAHGGEIMGDIPNFTNVQPLLQISEVRVEA